MFPTDVRDVERQTESKRFSAQCRGFKWLGESRNPTPKAWPIVLQEGIVSKVDAWSCGAVRVRVWHREHRRLVTAALKVLSEKEMATRKRWNATACDIDAQKNGLWCGG